MIILAKNNSTSDIEISDLGGISITSNSSKDLLLSCTLDDIAESNSLLELISSNQLIINNGIDDLSISDAIRYVSLFKHLNPISPDGKEVIKSESRPPGTQTSFTGIGDSDVGFHDGTKLVWDCSIDDDFFTADSSSLYYIRPIPDGFKQKIIRMKYNDPTYVKEGTLFYWNMQKGSFADMAVVCPPGKYYKDRSGTIHLADSYTVISHYVSHMMIYDTCSCGLHMFAETCQEDATPTYYETWVGITVPIDDTSSYGFGLFTLYRKRTALLPGETI